MEMSQSQAEREMEELAWADRKAYAEELDQEPPWKSHVRSIDAISNLPTRDNPQLPPALQSQTLADVFGFGDLSDPEFHRLVAYWGLAQLQQLYQFLNEKPVQILDGDLFFKVQKPLL